MEAAHSTSGLTNASLRGANDQYTVLGRLSAGRYRCVSSVSNSGVRTASNQHYSIIMYSADGSWGHVHANGITVDTQAVTYMNVGYALGAAVLPGEVYVEVRAGGNWEISCDFELEAPPPTDIDSPSAGDTQEASVRGTGSQYVLLGHMSAGHYRCQASVSDNRYSHGPSNFSIWSHSADREFGSLHANTIAEEATGTSRLFVGDGVGASVPAGDVYVEVTAVGNWEISCVRL